MPLEFGKLKGIKPLKRNSMQPPHVYSAAAAKSRQACPTLCDPIDGLLPGSSVPGILQARTLLGLSKTICPSGTF